MTDIQLDTGNTAIFTPQEASRYALEAIRQVAAQQSRGLKLNIAEIRDYLAPVMPGQVLAVIAQTSHYKSGFLHFWERTTALQLMDENRMGVDHPHLSGEASNGCSWTVPRKPGERRRLAQRRWRNSRWRPPGHQQIPILRGTAVWPDVEFISINILRAAERVGGRPGRHQGGSSSWIPTTVDPR
jgi:hypothetical protein